MDNYFMVQRQTIFKNVEVVIYVFDVEEPEEKLRKSLKYWQMAVKSVSQYNQSGAVFVLIHKIDKIAKSELEAVTTKKIAEINSMI